MKDLLKVSSGNSKLTSRNIVSIPAGLTCPKAKLCKSWASVINGKSQIVDGDETLFRCYAASQEAQYQRLEIIACIILKRF